MSALAGIAHSAGPITRPGQAPAADAPGMDTWAAISDIAMRQYGAVSRTQCLELGLASSSLDDHARRFRWQTLHPGVYALPGTARSFAQLATAACLAIESPALLTGSSALHMLGSMDARPSRIPLLLPARRAVPSREGIDIVRTERFDHVRSVTRGGLRLAAPPRAAADHARHLGPVPLGRVMAKACGLRQASPRDYAGELAARGRFPGRTPFRTALAMLQGELTHSGAERAARRHARAAGIEVWPRPYPVEHRGRVIAEIDMAAPWVLYGVEIDGPHHDLPEQAAADKQRDRELRRLGWTIDRFPVELIERHPEQFVREVRAAISLLDPTGIPAGSNKQRATSPARLPKDQRGASRGRRSSRRAPRSSRTPR